MTSLADTETRILEASSDIAEGDFDRDRNEQAIAIDAVWGVVTVHKGDCVSFEAHGLTAEQAAALLRALTPGWVVLATVELKRVLFQVTAPRDAAYAARDAAYTDATRKVTDDDDR